MDSQRLKVLGGPISAFTSPNLKAAIVGCVIIVRVVTRGARFCFLARGSFFSPQSWLLATGDAVSNATHRPATNTVPYRECDMICEIVRIRFDGVSNPTRRSV